MLEEPVITLPSDQEASGRSLGPEEVAQLVKAVESGTLTCTKGTRARHWRSFAELLGAKYVIACASGSAAVHCAIAAIDPEPGDEIIDPHHRHGSISADPLPGAIPVFADVDPLTGNITAGTIAARLSEKTKAIIVTHLFGNPCEMGPIVDLARERGLPVLEVRSGISRARWWQAGRNTRADRLLQPATGQAHHHGRRRVVRYRRPPSRPAHSAVRQQSLGIWRPDGSLLSRAQLSADRVARRGRVGAIGKARLGRRAAAEDGGSAIRHSSRGLQASPPRSASDAVHVFWRYCLWVDEKAVPGGSPGPGRSPEAARIAAAPRYIQKPAFQCEIFRDQRTFGRSRFPFTLARPEAVDYAPARFPGVFECLRDVLVLPWNERFTEQHVDFIAAAVRRQHARLAGR